MVVLVPRLPIGKAGQVLRVNSYRYCSRMVYFGQLDPSLLRWTQGADNEAPANGVTVDKSKAQLDGRPNEIKKGP